MILHLQVKPQKKFDRVEKKGDVWQVSIRAKPQDNEANGYLLRFLSEILQLPLAAMSIKRGHKSRIKQIEILADEQSLLAKLNSVLVSSRGK
jgi:uncharacterized protein YggU (UPF0235/DUF167 family)